MYRCNGTFCVDHTVAIFAETCRIHNMMNEMRTEMKYTIEQSYASREMNEFVVLNERAECIGYYAIHYKIDSLADEIVSIEVYHDPDSNFDDFRMLDYVDSEDEAYNMIVESFKF